MAESYLGEIKMFAGNFTPRDWLPCDGRILNIAQNQALFSILSNTFGGDGRTTFAIPDLRGCVPMHWGWGARSQPYAVGEKTGANKIILTPDNMPLHIHAGLLAGANKGNSETPGGNMLGTVSGGTTYGQSPTKDEKFMNAACAIIDPVGASAAHSNMQPYATTNFIICVSGYYPHRG